MSAMSFGRHGTAVVKLGVCSFIASIPVVLIASTREPSSVTDHLEGIGREQPVGPSSVRLAERSVGLSVEVGGAEVSAVPGEFA